MPNVSEINQELVRAFNIILCENDIGITNLIVQSTDQAFSKKKDRIVISFDKNMDVGQCMEYLHNIRESIVETFCGSESGANMSFNTKFFPFNFNESQLTKDKERYKFSVPIDKDIVLNLKCLLANGLARDVTGAMGRDHGLEYVEGHTSDKSFDRKSYLYCMQFYDKRLQDYFVESFSSRVKDYKNNPKKPGDFLKIKGNCVYIKASIFDNVEFIREVVKRKASLICRDFEVPSSDDEVVESLKFPMIDLLRGMGIPVDTILHTSYIGSGENSVLVPIIQITYGIGGKENCRLLNKKEADYINNVFGMVVLNNVEDCTSPKHLPVFGNGGVYGIDFYDKDISYCVLNKIMESSVINKDHELSIDPELRFRAFSPPSMPVHNGYLSSDEESGSSKMLRSQASIPTHLQNGSGLPNRYLDEAQLTQLRSPTGKSQDGTLKEPPRQGSGREKGELLYNQLGLAGTSGRPTTQVSYPAVSQHAQPEKCVNAAQSALEDKHKPTNRWSSSATSGNKWTSSTQFTQPGPIDLSWKGAAQNVQVGPSAWSSPASSAGFSSLSQSRPSSWKGANPVEANPWSQPMGALALPASSAELRQQSQVSSSGPSSSRGANESMRTGKSIWYVPSSYSPGVEDVNNVEPEKQQVSDECSEAKSQKSESPKEHGGSFKSKIKSFFSLNSKPKQHKASLKRCDVGRDTISSSRSDLVHPVTKKPPLSERSASERKAKSNPPSKVTSSTHEGAPGGLKPLTSDERKELRPFLSPELQKKLDSNSFSPGKEQHLYLTHTLSGKRELSRSLCEGKESQLLRLTKAQLPDNSSSKRDSGYSSGLPASPAVPHKESVSSEFKKCSVQQVKHMSEALGK